MAVNVLRIFFCVRVVGLRKRANWCETVTRRYRYGPCVFLKPASEGNTWVRPWLVYHGAIWPENLSSAVTCPPGPPSGRAPPGPLLHSHLTPVGRKSRQSIGTSDININKWGVERSSASRSPDAPLIYWRFAPKGTGLRIPFGEWHLGPFEPRSPVRLGKRHLENSAR